MSILNICSFVVLIEDNNFCSHAEQSNAEVWKLSVNQSQDFLIMFLWIEILGRSTSVPEGEVWLTVQREGEDFRIILEDQGCSIPLNIKLLYLVSSEVLKTNYLLF